MKRSYLISLLVALGMLLAANQTWAAAPTDLRLATSSQKVVANFTGAPSVSYSVYRSTDGNIFTVLSTYTTGATGGTGAGWTDTLTCGSCHDPHATAHNYRALVSSKLDSPSINVQAYAASAIKSPITPSTRNC
ncbi:MAG: hypothetical protein M1598_07195 [Actinobacteria bacterium]|nr:hypothetical protein [Actinomycetota bacterium]